MKINKPGILFKATIEDAGEDYTMLILTPVAEKFKVMNGYDASIDSEDSEMVSITIVYEEDEERDQQLKQAAKDLIKIPNVKNEGFFDGNTQVNNINDSTETRLLVPIKYFDIES